MSTKVGHCENPKSTPAFLRSRHFPFDISKQNKEMHYVLYLSYGRKIKENMLTVVCFGVSMDGKIFLEARNCSGRYSRSSGT